MKKGNNVIILLGAVHGSPTATGIVEFTVKCYNTVDMLSKDPNSNYACNIPGYKDREDLEAILENLRSNIGICWHGEGVDQIMKEEDSE